MNSTSPASRLVRMAARSPARSRTGPEVMRNGAPISVAMRWASVVLPSPGGPNSSVWSRLSPRSRAARMKIRRLSTILRWPTYSSSWRGRNEGSTPRSSGSGAPESSRSSESMHRHSTPVSEASPRRRRRRLAPRQAAEAGAQQVLEWRVGAVAAGFGDGALGLGGLVAEVDERGDDLLAGRGGTAGELGGELAHLVAELEDHALGGLAADAGDAGEAAEVAGRQRRQQIVRGHAGEHYPRQAGADAGDRDQLLEELLLALAPEAEQRDAVLTQVGVDEEPDGAARAGALDLVEGGQRDLDLVADALDVDQHPLGAGAQDRALEVADQALSRLRLLQPVHRDAQRLEQLAVVVHPQLALAALQQRHQDHVQLLLPESLARLLLGGGELGRLPDLAVGDLEEHGAAADGDRAAHLA